MNQDFKNTLETMAKDVENDLLVCFEKPFDAPAIIVSAMKYSLFAGGKRIRPVLMRKTCELFGGDVENVRALSCAIEMIHTYSLIHDDLPAMDDDDLRRGQPSNHKVYGEDIAILAGDALLNYAVETAVDGLQRLPAQQQSNGIQALKILMQASGVGGLIGGQVGDVLAEDDDEMNAEKLKYIHSHKTGAMLTAALLCGAVMANADSESLEWMRQYGEAIGTAFQIVDDILDITSDTEVLGKPVGSDQEEHKTTMVSLYGLKSAQEKVEEYHRTAIEALSNLSIDTSFYIQMADFVCNRVY